jgi:peptide-methionine (R)-S-oxide reductase
MRVSPFICGAAHVVFLVITAAGCNEANMKPPSPSAPGERIVRSEEQWRAMLTPQQYYILREKGTEPAFQNAYYDNHDAGMYVCAGCQLELFSSNDKYDSGTGWPSFSRPIAPGSVANVADADGSRIEVVCARCGGHLGHVFDDGPAPTGLRYCMNSAAMTFKRR